MLDKKQIWAIFLLEFKMGYKAAEINCNINNTHAPGTAKERTVQSWLKKLSEGDESLEDEKRNDQPSEVDNDQLRRSSKLLLLQLHEKLPKNSTWTILQSFSIWSKLEKWNSLISGYLMSWLQVKKNQHFEVLSSFIVCNKNKPFLDRIVTRNEQCILYDNRQWPAQWLDREEAPKHFPKPKKGHGHCLMACCPSDPLQLSESWQNHYIWEVETYAQQWMRCTENCNTYSQSYVNRKGPILHDNAWPQVTQPTLQKLNELGDEVLPHQSSDLSPTSHQGTTTCYKENVTTSRRQKMLSKSSLNPEAQMVTNLKTNLFLIGNNVLIIVVPILINKDVFESRQSETPITFSPT